MIVFFLYGYTFTYNGLIFEGNFKELVNLYNQYITYGRDYYPLGHNLFLILSSIYPEESFDFTNEDRTEFFYIISMPDITQVPDNIFL